MKYTVIAIIFGVGMGLLFERFGSVVFGILAYTCAICYYETSGKL